MRVSRLDGIMMILGLRALHNKAVITPQSSFSFFFPSHPGAALGQRTKRNDEQQQHGKGETSKC